MASLLLALVVALTSLGAFLLATRRAGLRWAGLSEAVAEALDYLGLAVVFLIANLIVGATLIIAFRALTRQFISVYVLNDTSLLFLSLLQALVLHCWRQRWK